MPSGKAGGVVFVASYGMRIALKGAKANKREIMVISDWSWCPCTLVHFIIRLRVFQRSVNGLLDVVYAETKIGEGMKASKLCAGNCSVVPMNSKRAEPSSSQSKK